MISLRRWGKCIKQGYFMKKQWLQGLTGNPTAAAVLSDGGIMSGVNVEGGSIPLVDFCWIRCMAKENCSRFSLPVCLVSASPLQTSRLLTLLKDTFNKLSWTHRPCVSVNMHTQQCQRCVDTMGNYLCVLMHCTSWLLQCPWTAISETKMFFNVVVLEIF